MLWAIKLKLTCTDPTWAFKVIEIFKKLCYQFPSKPPLLSRDVNSSLLSSSPPHYQVNLSSVKLFSLVFMDQSGSYWFEEAGIVSGLQPIFFQGGVQTSLSYRTLVTHFGIPYLPPFQVCLYISFRYMKFTCISSTCPVKNMQWALNWIWLVLNGN